MDKSGDCWLWTHRVEPNGYGRFNAHEHAYLAHRVSYELANGPIAPGLYVIHTCDEYYPPGDVSYRRCVNPAHLVVGTNADNMKQMHRVGRAAPIRKRMGLRGEDNPLTRITEADVRTIRAEAAKGPRGVQIDLARRYGLSATTICNIVKRKVWAHVE